MILRVVMWICSNQNLTAIRFLGTDPPFQIDAVTKCRWLAWTCRCTTTQWCPIGSSFWRYKVLLIAGTAARHTKRRPKRKRRVWRLSWWGWRSFPTHFSYKILFRAVQRFFVMRRYQILAIKQLPSISWALTCSWHVFTNSESTHFFVENLLFSF